MNFPQWIDSDDLDIRHDGEVFFLVETLDTSTGRTSWSLRERPLRMNRSAEPRFARLVWRDEQRKPHAHGLVRVVRADARS